MSNDKLGATRSFARRHARQWRTRSDRVAPLTSRVFVITPDFSAFAHQATGYGETSTEYQIRASTLESPRQRSGSDRGSVSESVTFAKYIVCAGMAMAVPARLTIAVTLKSSSSWMAMKSFQSRARK
jgi:hypothetical protein